jgi:hypothetical protein
MHTAVWRCTARRSLRRYGACAPSASPFAAVYVIVSQRVGHHPGERLADVVDFALRDHGLLEGHELGQRREPQRDRRHRGALGDIVGREYGMHAGYPPRLLRGDGADAPMGDAAAQDRRVQHAFDVLVVDIRAAPAQQAQVLEALDGFSDGLHLPNFSLYAERAS